MAVTIKDIAKRSGVSYSTVSKALRNSSLVKENTKEKILKIANELGYQPNVVARSLVSKKSWTIGVVWPTVERVAPSALISKINEHLEEYSYTTLLSFNRIDSAIDTFNRFQVDAILVFYDKGDHNINSNPHPSGVPILYYGISESSPYPTIDVNRRKAVKLAVEYLCELGHENIAYIGDLSSKDLLQEDKVIGFKDAICEMDIPFYPEMIVPINGLESHDGYLAARNIIQKANKPTAIISGSYDLTRGILRAVKEANLKIPDDVSIVSYDNIPQMANLDIPITVVGVPLMKITNEVTQTLLKIIDEKEEVQNSIILEPELVVRKSTAPLS